MHSFFDLLIQRRSIRKFADQEIEADKLEQVLNAGLIAPASKSKNPWEFVVVSDPQKKEELALCKEHSASFISQAPIAIVVTADSSLSDVWIEDASVAMILMQLQGENIGLGSCWVQIRNRFTAEGEPSQDYVKRVLNIPSHISVLAILSIGYKGQERKLFDVTRLQKEKIHYNGWS